MATRTRSRRKSLTMTAFFLVLIGAAGFLAWRLQKYVTYQAMTTLEAKKRLLSRVDVK